MKQYTVTVSQTFQVLAETSTEAIGYAKAEFDESEAVWNYEERATIDPALILTDMIATRPEAEPRAWQVEWGMDWERTYYGEGKTSKQDILMRAARQIARELQAADDYKG